MTQNIVIHDVGIKDRQIRLNKYVGMSFPGNL